MSERARELVLKLQALIGPENHPIWEMGCLRWINAFKDEVRRETLREAIRACGEIASREELQSNRNVGIDCMTAIRALDEAGVSETGKALSHDPHDYVNAPSGIGPLASEWTDKPHRLVYDLAMEVMRLRAALRAAEPATTDRGDEDG